MKNKSIIINTQREGYGIDQIRKTMTIEQIIEYFEGLKYDCGGNTKVYLAFDSGYTYGGIVCDRIEIEYGESEDDDEEESIEEI